MAEAPGEGRPVGRPDAFVAWLLGSVLVLLALVALGNALVDPRSMFGSGLVVGAHDNGDRRAKLDRLDRAAEPEQVIVVGSSRAMKVDPRVIEQLSGASARNLAHSGAMPANVLAIVKYVGERRGGRLPHVIYGLDLEGFRVATADPFLLTDARMRRQLSWSQRARTALDAAGTLVDMETTRSSLDLVRTQGSWESGRPQLAQRSAAAARRTDALYRADGFYLSDYGFGRGATLESRMRVHIARFFDGVLQGRSPFVRLEPEQQRVVREIVAWSNAHGEVPTIYLTPFQPEAWQQFLPFGVADRRREVQRFMDSLEAEGLELRYVDALDPASFGASAGGFYDDIHPNEQTNERLLARLDALGALGPG